MLQAGKPHEGKPDERILDDGTVIRFTADSLFEVAFPDGRTELWNPVTCERTVAARGEPETALGDGVFCFFLWRYPRG